MNKNSHFLLVPIPLEFLFEEDNSVTPPRGGEPLFHFSTGCVQQLPGSKWDLDRYVQ